MGGGGGGGGGWTGVCVLGDGGGVGRLNLSGLLLLRGEGLCRQDRNSRSEQAQTAHPQPSVTRSPGRPKADPQRPNTSEVLVHPYWLLNPAGKLQQGRVYTDIYEKAMQNHYETCIDQTTGLR